MLSVIQASSTGASGFIAKSCVHTIRVPAGTSSYRQWMFMWSKGPVSTRRALTVSASRSGSRSETQLHTVPFSSGCMVSRKVVFRPSRRRTSTEAYSLNSRGQFSRSLVISQTRSRGAAMLISFCVCPVISRSCHEGTVDEVEELPGRLGTLGVGGHRRAVPVLQLAHDAQQAERVDAEAVEAGVVLPEFLRGDGDAGGLLHEFGQLFHGDAIRHAVPLLYFSAAPRY